MRIRDIVDTEESLGVRSVSIADHLNRSDGLRAHREIRCEMEALESDIAIYFGAELGFAGFKALEVLTAEAKGKHGFQLVLGGLHYAFVARDRYDLKRIIALQHEAYVAMCESPVVDIIAHPGWFD